MRDSVSRRPCSRCRGGRGRRAPDGDRQHLATVGRRPRMEGGRGDLSHPWPLGLPRWLPPRTPCEGILCSTAGAPVRRRLGAVPQQGRVGVSGAARFSCAATAVRRECVLPGETTNSSAAVRVWSAVSVSVFGSAVAHASRTSSARCSVAERLAAETTAGAAGVSPVPVLLRHVSAGLPCASHRAGHSGRDCGARTGGSERAAARPSAAPPLLTKHHLRMPEGARGGGASPGLLKRRGWFHSAVAW